MNRVLMSLFAFCLLAMPAFGETVLYDFYADWCGPCKAMTPIVDRLAGEGYTVQRVNVDQNRGLAAQYGVTSVPAFVVVENKQVVDRVVGKTTYDRLRKALARKTVKAIGKSARKAAKPTWRLVESKGRYASVVRVLCKERGGVSKGSGVMVHWGNRVVVLTNWHVVKDASDIIVRFHNGKRSRANIIKADRKWDCAVLDIGEAPTDIEPAEVAMTNTLFSGGEQLEACGYGPDGELACSTGEFLTYTQPARDTGKITDWMVVSGEVRSGDSGGPIFNEKGAVVGVLWGDNTPDEFNAGTGGVAMKHVGSGPEVSGVQIGRLHEILNQSLSGNSAQFCRSQQASYSGPTPPALGALVPVVLKKPMATEQAKFASGEKPLLPWRKEAEAKDRKQDEMLGRLIALEEKQAVGNVSVEIGNGPPTYTQPQIEPEKKRQSPLLGGLCLFAGVIGGFVIYFASQKGE